MSRGIRARIRLSALKHNIERARTSAPNSRVMAVIKADAYGHGLLDTARALSEHADAFAVEDADEGAKLREAGIRQDIVLLSGFHEVADLETITRFGLSPVVHDHWQVRTLSAAGLPGPISVWVKVDSGMHRAGFDPEDVPRVMNALARLQPVRIDGVMSHLANADDLSDPSTREQCRVFRDTADGLDCPLSLANSPGVLGWPETHLDWIRPGMMLYGCSPLRNRSEAELDLQPAMTLESRIIAIRTVAAGGAVGYGGTWRCEQATRVGVLACGYGDGYPRHAPNDTPVSVNGAASRIIGRASMDLITIDLSFCERAEVGDWVELWGGNVTASTVAAHAGTIPYELVTRVAARVPRIYEN